MATSCGPTRGLQLDLAWTKPWTTHRRKRVFAGRGPPHATQRSVPGTSDADQLVIQGAGPVPDGRLRRCSPASFRTTRPWARGVKGGIERNKLRLCPTSSRCARNLSLSMVKRKENLGVLRRFHLVGPSWDAPGTTRGAPGDRHKGRLGRRSPNSAPGLTCADARSPE
jgi:hypothetical protein